MNTGTSKKIVVIGSLFDDCHRVGVDIIEKSLKEEGFTVVNLGITTPLESFLQCVPLADILLISSVNGHAFEHLAQEEMIFRFEQTRKQHPHFPIILGGNLHSYKDPEYIREFLEKKVGFTRVFPKPVGGPEVIAITRQYLSKSTNSSSNYSQRLEALQKLTDAGYVNIEYQELAHIADNKIDEKQVTSVAQEFRYLWRTANEIPPVEEILDYQLGLPVRMNEIIRRADQQRPTLIQPRCGVGNAKDQTYIFKRLVAAGADIVSFQVDSNTRNGEFYENEKLLKDKALINGYPVINHGVKTSRHIVEQVMETPVQVRHGSKPKVSVLLAYISFAAGVTGFEGASGTYLFPYFKSIPLANSIHYWQRVDRLVGVLASKGCIIDREFFGTLTATLIPPEIAITFNIIEALLAARQGVKSISLGYAEQGNRKQDIAALTAIRSLTRKYLDDFNYKDVEISTVMNSFMAGFPVDRVKAEEIIRESAITARLGKATRTMIKTAVEAMKIPTVEDNVQAIALTKQGFFLADNYYKEHLEQTAINAERDMIETTVKAIMDSILDCGSGDIARGFVNALKKGYIDLPFSPNFQVKNQVLTVRDCGGAVRIYHPGNIQVPADILQLNKALVDERLRKEDEQKVSRLIYHDVTRISLGKYIKWPLDGHYVAAN